MCYLDLKFGCGHSALVENQEVNCHRPLQCTFMQKRAAVNSDTLCAPCRWHLENPGTTYEEKRKNFEQHTNYLVAQMEELEQMKETDDKRHKVIEKRHMNEKKGL